MTFFEEIISAGRGFVALVFGRRDAPGYFDFSLRGLAGSFVAFLVTMAATAYLPAILSPENSGPSPWQNLAISLFFFVLQVAGSAIALAQFRRLDGFIPYIVADNWATLFVGALSIILGIVGFNDGLALTAVFILLLVVEINVARLVVTLTPVQIAIFLVAQVIGIIVGLLIIGMIIPLDSTALNLQGATT